MATIWIFAVLLIGAEKLEERLNIKWNAMQMLMLPVRLKMSASTIPIAIAATICRSWSIPE